MFKSWRSFEVRFSGEYPNLVSKMLGLERTEYWRRHEDKAYGCSGCGRCWECNMGGCQACEYGVPHLKGSLCDEYYDKIMADFDTSEVQMVTGRMQQIYQLLLGG